ncbi:Protein FD [Abeliophyllum distichum]|uniref:Protein FD n=1 Tax=Abeliophyllum distichum TaxID=126358 RepID=A0ABD1SA03_9LAMI
MEEVWNDINLASLQEHPTDFLARPFTDKDSVPTASVSPAQAPPPPTTMLTLNSRPECFHFFGNSDPPLQPQTISHSCCVNVACEGHGKKRFNDSDSNSAYTNELEAEVANLLEENASLKKQQQQLYLAAVPQVRTKQALRRTSTAPF